MNIDQTITSAKPAAKGEKFDPAQKLKLQKAVREFESVFVGYLLKSMRNTIQKADNQTDSFGADMLESMFDVELARHVSKSSNMGLAEMLYRKMTEEELPRPVKSIAPSTLASPKKETPVRPAVAKPKTKISTEAQRPTATTSRNMAKQSVAAITKIDKPVELKMIALQQAVAPRDAVSVKSVEASAVQRATEVSRHRTIERRINQYQEYIAEAADKHGVRESLIKAVIASESAGRANTRSPKDAKGLMQLIDTTAAAMGVKNVWNPRDNILGGAKYLKQMLDRFDGDEQLALASYNAGPGNVVKHGGIPPFKETKAYVARAMNFLQVFAEQENTNE
ncbi:MAG: transglycosylase SLT domain-containing protein [Ignavibacteriae bacterium]|nr:transglycosylase SLT domain-containing protein [Ignavibacteriota bacterium]